MTVPFHILYLYSLEVEVVHLGFQLSFISLKGKLGSVGRQAHRYRI